MSKRSKMLASVIREVIVPVVQKCPAQCGIVSITEVDVSDDFSFATIYISALHHPENAITFLVRHTKELHTKIGRLYRKKIPQIRFRLDYRIDRGERIDNLLSEAQKDTDN